MRQFVSALLPLADELIADDITYRMNGAKETSQVRLASDSGSTRNGLQHDSGAAFDDDSEPLFADQELSTWQTSDAVVASVYRLASRQAISAEEAQLLLGACVSMCSVSQCLNVLLSLCACGWDVGRT